MRVLFVAPSNVSSGEAITAHHMAHDVVAHGGEVRFLASALAAGFLGEKFRDRLTEFTPDAAHNRTLWERTIRKFHPHVVAFADYPLLFFPSGSAPMVDDRWVRSLDDVDAGLVTLDHLGYAQRPMTVYFGPPHLSMHSATSPDLPARMAVALPCPIHDPGPVVGRTGSPFRYWNKPKSSTEGQIRRIRGRFLRDERDFLIVHSAPRWAWETAEIWGLPYYQFLSGILAYHLVDLPRPATIVSVNNGDLLSPLDDGKVRIINLAALPSSEYELLLLACDLMLTENSISVSLGKAVCGLRPSGVLRNSFRLVDLLRRDGQGLRGTILKMEASRMGAIFPYEVFPIWGRNELDQLGIHRENSFADTFARVEVFDGDETPSELRGLLLDETIRGDMRSRQEAYVRELGTLPEPEEMLRRVAGL
jgi:hypothetical protein